MNILILKHKLNMFLDIQDLRVFFTNMNDWTKLTVKMWSHIILKSGWIWPWITLKKIKLKSTKNSIFLYSLGISEDQTSHPTNCLRPHFRSNLSSIFYCLLFWPQDRHQSVSTHKFGLKISNVSYVQKWGGQTVRK